MHSHFNFERLTRLSEIEAQHFWFAGRRTLLKRLMGRFLPTGNLRILDLGCGTGFMVLALSQQGMRVLGVDGRPEGLRRASERAPGSWLVQADAMRLPLADQVFDAVMLLDVLEHIPQQPLLEEVRRVLTPSGLVFLTVPAMPWLWSYRDVAAGHLRRYTRRLLIDHLTAAGLRIEDLRYYQFLLFPFAVITRLLGRRGRTLRDMEDRPLPLINLILTTVSRLEVRLGRYIAWPWGLSLAAVGRRPL